MKSPKAISMLVAAGLLMTSTSAFAVVDGPKVQGPDQVAITIYQPNIDPVVTYDPDLHRIMIGAPEVPAVSGHWSKFALDHLLNAGVLTRNEADVFEPNKEITKDDFQIWTNRILGKKDGAPEPASAMTRLDAAVWLADLLPALNTGINGANLLYPFNDTQGISEQQKSAVHYLYKLGIMVGDGQGKFSPKSKLSKGEAAVLLDKVLERASSVAKPAAYEVVTGLYPETVNTVVKENKTEPGVYTVVEDGVRYLVIAGGEAPNPGYSVELTSLGESDGAFFVNANVKAPEKGNAHPEVISYPVLVVKTAESKKPVFMMN
ncbi:hypothetical protein CIG75_09915 [Tumebacillus algifaecis]|uniref:SLH domain-containing protein n=1 Tax=Tumebacillus algifaecis TaxID=1214604 RepID=A0A223D0Y0_9BACL|nr:S-layer homology domain-containing protein [Tumebacillus algifaecis]ASS75270.1 hypothetical protein CIG75_09915 [Tumebacillus algifaecis]